MNFLKNIIYNFIIFFKKFFCHPDIKQFLGLLDKMFRIENKKYLNIFITFYLYLIFFIFFLSLIFFYFYFFLVNFFLLVSPLKELVSSFLMETSFLSSFFIIFVFLNNTFIFISIFFINIIFIYLLFFKKDFNKFQNILTNRQQSIIIILFLFFSIFYLIYFLYYFFLLLTINNELTIIDFNKKIDFNINDHIYLIFYYFLFFLYQKIFIKNNNYDFYINLIFYIVIEVFIIVILLNIFFYLVSIYGSINYVVGLDDEIIISKDYIEYRNLLNLNLNSTQINYLYMNTVNNGNYKYLYPIFNDIVSDKQIFMYYKKLHIYEQQCFYEQVNKVPYYFCNLSSNFFFKQFSLKQGYTISCNFFFSNLYYMDPYNQYRINFKYDSFCLIQPKFFFIEKGIINYNGLVDYEIFNLIKEKKYLLTENFNLIEDQSLIEKYNYNFYNLNDLQSNYNLEKIENENLD